jgi:hypothetical protein
MMDQPAGEMNLGMSRSKMLPTSRRAWSVVNAHTPKPTVELIHEDGDCTATAIAGPTAQ